MADGAAIAEKPPGYVFGRPAIYRVEHCKRIIELGELGFSQAQMAADIGIAKATINLWAQQYPDFMNALSHARTLSQAWWEREAQAGLRDRDFNAGIWDKSVKSRFREDYTDRTVQEIVGKDDGAIEIKDGGADARKVAFMLGRAIGRQEKAAADSTKV